MAPIGQTGTQFPQATHFLGLINISSLIHPIKIPVYPEGTGILFNRIFLANVMFIELFPNHT
jgi:hypothetical protein